eukprot:TRINITY_DN92987_c0_g1_i1.p1 TRINITY_DN92987_c0_g1~~TRINITY_DN92987_c0_g1_i1.p1  ORF type:complete len:517 (+),score=99.65 TRINITY_DN92987_c0_g1_i1:52-1602(+)
MAAAQAATTSRLAGLNLRAALDVEGSGKIDRLVLERSLKSFDAAVFDDDVMAALLDAIGSTPRGGHVTIDDFLRFLADGLEAPAKQSIGNPEAPSPLQIGADLGALEKEAFGRHAPSYDWVRKANDPDHRALRSAVARQTLEATTAEGYAIMDAPTQRLSTSAMVEGTAIISVSQGNLDTGSSDVELRHVRGMVLEVAVQCARDGKEVLAVSAASAYHAGGGFITGGRHALEEAICMQTTLYASLEQAKRLALGRASTHPAEHQPAHAEPPTQNDGNPWHRHVPVGGVVFSPGVEVFRGGTYDGYQFWETPVRLAGVASVAAFNKNSRVRDSPLDAPPDQDEYMQDLRNAFCSALVSAQACGATTVVMPDAGCGVFRNAPDEVGRALGEVLAAHPWYGIREVLISGHRDFFAAALDAAGKAKAGRQLDRSNSHLERGEAAITVQSSFRGKRDRKGYPEVHGDVDDSRTGASSAPCKFGCGRNAAPGRTRSGRPFDTCCRSCARSRGAGKHCPDCLG